MKVKYGSGTTQYGPGVEINLSGAEVATAIDAKWGDYIPY